MNHSKRFLTTMGVAAGLVAGGGAGLILQSAGSASASTSAAVVAPPTNVPATTTPSSDDAGAPTTPAPAAAKASARLQQILQPLIDDDTLTQAQADAVIAQLEAARPASGNGHADGHNERGRHAGRAERGIRVEFDKVATLLGVTTDDLRTALKDGTTLAAFAESKGKTGQDVTDLLVADAKAHLDAKVTDGSMTQADADTKLAKATTRITEFVNNGRPAHPDRPAGDAPTNAPAAPVTTAG